MCQGCYEQYGAPKDYCLVTPFAISLIQDVYRQPHGGAGGGMHIVVDDFNIEAESIQWCMDQPDATGIEKVLGYVLLSMTEEQRATALAVHDQMIPFDTSAYMAALVKEDE